MTEAQKISDVYRKYWDGMIRKDTDLLRSLMSEDYYLEHMTGVRQSKETFRRELTGGTFNYYSADHDSIAVRVDGDKAFMIGKSRVLAAVYGGGYGLEKHAVEKHAGDERSELPSGHYGYGSKYGDV